MLVSGARYGAFEILDRLGAGGMGEVYRARDLRLDRTVALKVIRTSDSRQRDQLERFKREARAISRLNHPHICTLYDIGEQDGEAFLVMEYVAGETLADRLARGPLRLEDVLRYGIEIAKALDAAHRQGVVHRDLKPSNIMITRDGVKLLDFGLAKLRQVDRNTVGEAATTFSLGLSEDGLIVGSLPYMAPEQLEGRDADARTDLFAFGVVLYEMITGVRPFRGESTARLLVAILSEEPAAPVTREPLTPRLLNRAITRCLAKAPDDRWQTAADLSAELEYVLETSRDSTTNTGKVSSPLRRRLIVTVGTTLIAIGALGAIGLWLLNSVQPSSPSFHRLTWRRGIITGARITPDGQTIVYSASWEGAPYDLYLTRVGSPESRSLSLPDGRLLGISTANEIAFLRGPQSIWRASGTLARVPLAGGAPREVLDDVASADWSPDGAELAVIRSIRDAPGKLQVEFPIGHKVYESSLGLSSIRISPAGDRVVVMEGGNPRTIVVVDRAGQKTVVSNGWWPALGVAWSPRGDEIWFTGSHNAPPALRAVSLDGKERLLANAPDALRIHDVSRDGRVLVVRDVGREGFACRAADDRADRDLSWFDGSALEALSTDGRTVVFGEIRGGGGATLGIYVRKIDGSAAVRLADGFPEDISPDGRSVLKRPTDDAHGWELVPVGTGLPRRLPRGTVDKMFEANFLPDGRGIAFAGAEKGKGTRIFVQRFEDGVPRPISPEGVHTIGLTRPDGKYVLGSMGGQHLLFSVEGGPPRALSFLSSNDSPLQWTADGRFLYVLRGAPWSNTDWEVYHVTEAQIDIIDTVTGMRKPWTTVRPNDPVGLETISDLHITPDGRTYCFGYGRTLSDLFVINDVK